MFLVYAISRDILIIDNGESVTLMVNPDEDKLLYIGITGRSFEQRMIEHKKDSHNLNYTTSQKFYNRIRNHWDDFDKTILIDNIKTKQEALDIEVHLIELYNSYHKGLNSTRGGDRSLSGSDHPKARKIIGFDSEMNKETRVYDWIQEAVIDLDLNQSVGDVLNKIRSEHKQVYSKRYERYFQFKYVDDPTPFVINMPRPEEKHIGKLNNKARKIIGFDSELNKETRVYDWIQEAVEDLDLKQGYKCVLNDALPTHKQVYSKKFERYFQLKYVDDPTPFVIDMPRPTTKRCGIGNGRAKRVCAYGKLYETAKAASQDLRDRKITENKNNFIKGWIIRNTHATEVFEVSLRFYERYKDDINITKEMYTSFEIQD
ncbi:GIY-YIG catalytic domain-containing endonuclease [Paramecium bursaria Chlorella virus NY2B]|uniref:GIY-YIG catalytic domain-containing endonuclease n=1 Tax=Paramecium bursaria Chlorella virus NYs1 TaxID=83442 RepID=M1I8E2_9PHYC|nr:GIY-YIG catalytic domain-containing endonuclease [Paramecium bursaria Chlorella virus NYs1]AGE58405.1 GIY-YIG catalytic domain-containing endonuclease [Paramecium bursaria Chlorella virus NY2B]AGE58789.1 GIY-YIG catalytic domain-containing endonuclease [Paramecium bursaria Chlorella virus NYs1]